MPKEDTQFKPGESGNPNGRPKLSKEIKQARKITQTILEGIIYKYLDYTPEQITEASKDKQLPMIEHIVISIIAKAYRNKDHVSFDFILNRSLGRIPEKKIHTGDDGGPIKVNIIK